MKKVYGFFALIIGVLLLNVEAAAQYCVPRASSTWDGITKVATTGGAININKSTAMQGRYNNYTSTDSISVFQGQSFNLEVVHQYSVAVYIDWDDNGSFNTTNERLVYQNSYQGTGPNTTRVTVPVPLTSSTGQLRMRVLQGYHYGLGACGSSWTGETEDYRLWIPEPKTNDAGLTELQPDLACAGANDVKVRITNFGTDTLKSVVLNGSIEEIGGATTTYGPTTISGLALARFADTLYNVTSYNFLSNKKYNINFYTTLPNGVVDSSTLNDTLNRFDYAVAMQGNITVGNTGNYPTLDSALNDLHRYGLCQSVVLQLMDTVFSENVKIDGIRGNSAAKTITIVNHPSNTKPAIVSGSITLGKASHITVKGITFNRSGNVFTASGSSNTDNIVIDSCEFNFAGSSGYAFYDDSRAQNIDGLTFTNNTVNKGGGGLYLYGGSTSNSSLKDARIKISNNKFIGWAGTYAMYLYNIKDLEIKNNKIYSEKSNVSYSAYAINGRYCDDYEISYNDIQVVGDRNSYGMYLYYSNRYSSGDSAKIINNFITVNSINPTSRWNYKSGIYSYFYNYRMLIYHNNIAVLGGSGGTIYALHTRNQRNSDIKNNVIENTVGGDTWNNNGSSSTTNDGNAFWTGISTNNGLNGITAGTNSVVADPRYKDVNIGDLRVNSLQLDSAVAPVGVMDDFFGTARVGALVDVGAHQFEPCYADAYGIDFFTDYTKIPVGQAVKMNGEIGNLGLDSIVNTVGTATVGASSTPYQLGTILSDSSKKFNVVVPVNGPVGVVNASLVASTTSPECDRDNDTLRYSFEVSDTTYALDHDTVNNRLGFGYPNTGEFGNVFEIFNTDTVSSGTFYLNGPTQGATVRLKLYSVDSTGPKNVLDSTRKIIVGANGTGWYTLSFGCNGVVVQPGRYFIAIEQSNPVRMELGIYYVPNVTIGRPATRFFKGTTATTWTDLSATTNSRDVQHAELALRMNLGRGYSADVLSDTTLICNNSDTYIKMNSDFVSQLWSNGLFFDSIKVKTPGVYSVRVVDAIGCIYDDTTTALMATPMNITTTPVKASCGMSDGSASIAVSGSYAPHTFMWNTGDTTMSLTNIPGADYEVTVTDSIGCQNKQKVQVLGAYPQISSGWNYPTCNGDSDGKAETKVDKGVMPYTYAWNAGGTPSNATNIQLKAGTYVVTVTDKSGCQTLDTVEVKDPAVLVARGNVTAPSACKMADGSIVAYTNGGLAPYSYQWSDGQRSKKAVGLTKGIYDVTITDSLGCQTISAAQVFDPNSPISIPNNLMLDCSYDTTTAKVVIQGGTAPYQYSWNYNNAKTETLKGVSSGSYKLLLTDAAGCDHDTTVVITAPTKVVVNFTNIQDNGENDVDVTASTTGGTAPYSYNWVPTGDTDSIGDNLPNGVNKVTVVDAKGCSFTYQIDVFSETTGIGVLADPTAYNIYPNPSKGLVNVELNLNAEQSVRVRVMNAVGELIRVIEKDNVVQDRIEVDLSNEAVGMYFIETTAGTDKVVTKVQISH